jgi:cobalt/nickel transport system permease protein
LTAFTQETRMALPLHDYAAARSTLDALAPATRIVCATLFSIAAALLAGLSAAWLALGLGALLLALARPRWSTTLRRLVAANLFLAFLWLFLPFSTPGTPVYAVGPLTVSAEGLRAAGLITLKSNAILCAFAGLVAGLDPASVGRGLQTLRAPALLCQLLLFALRYAHLIAEEYERLADAMRIRAFRPRCNLHTYRSYAYLVGMLLVRSWERAERVYNAMLCRGFDGRFHSLQDRPLRARDALASGLGLILAAGLLLFDARVY